MRSTSSEANSKGGRREVSVVVPGSVEEAEEPHTPLDQAAREQAVGGKRAVLPRSTAALWARERRVLRRADFDPRSFPRDQLAEVERDTHVRDPGGRATQTRTAVDFPHRAKALSHHEASGTDHRGAG